MRFWCRSGGMLLAVWPLGGCAGWQSALDPHADSSEEIRHIFLLFLAVAAVVWLSVMLVLASGLVRRKRTVEQPLELHQPFEIRAGRVILGAGGATLIIVLALSVVSYGGQRSVFAKSPDALTIQVTGHQWWWEARYVDGPNPGFATANEIRVPVGRPVKLELGSEDVIHSFWVPSLAGKMDLIPGQQNSLQFVAKNPGVYRGQCAEFCGVQHAHMALTVHALPPDEFAQWRDRQSRGASTPADPLGRQGEQLFRAKGCSLCHTIRGTLALGIVGPDLTHVGSRSTIAAGTLPFSPGSLGAWIADPQHIKPGNLMPQVPLRSDQLIALIRYLEQLK